MDAARKRVFARQTEIAQIVLIGYVERRIDALHGSAADRGEGVAALRAAVFRLVERSLIPLFLRAAEVV